VHALGGGESTGTAKHSPFTPTSATGVLLHAVDGRCARDTVPTSTCGDKQATRGFAGGSARVASLAHACDGCWVNDVHGCGAHGT
jgi:hypothetical protein